MVPHEARSDLRRQRRSARGGVGRVRADRAPAAAARRPRPPSHGRALDVRGGDRGAARAHGGRARVRGVPPDGRPRGGAGQRARGAGRARAPDRPHHPGPGARDGDRPDRRRLHAHARRPARLHRAARGPRGRARRAQRRGRGDGGGLICMPIRVEDRVIGVINLAKGAASPVDPRAFSPMDLQFLSTLIAHVAYALENARLLEESRLSTERLQNVVEDLRTAQTRLVEGETGRALGQMASGMAHHLNNLLAVVSGRLQLLLMRVQDPVLRKPLETAERAVGDAAEVVRRVLGFAAAQPVPETNRVDLNEVAADVIELTRPRWQDTAQLRHAMIDIRFEPGDDVVVAGAPAALREVLMNLVLNSLDAMPEGGCLSVRTWTEDGWVYCSVGDTGAGMSADTRQRALQPFFTTKGPKGVGLGLSVSLGVIQRHRGEMEIQSAEGRGTVVTLRIPRPGVTPPPDTIPLTPSPAAPLKILIVDDEPAVLEALADTLAEDGHTVLSAGGGREALAVLDGGERVDLVITDLGMPGMTGWEVARALRTRQPDLPVGLISGWTNSADFSAEEASHVAFVVAKPYTLGALRTALAPFRPRR